MGEAPIAHLAAHAYRIPTGAPEADGTFAWNATTVVVVEIEAGGVKGLGYSFADAASAQIVLHVLADAICGLDAFAIPKAWAAMVAAVRNIGWRGVSACAISAVDVALWDLKSRLLAVPLPRLLGQLRDEVPVYGSGGFTSYSIERLQQQLAAWIEQDGCRWVKMKVGTAPDEDVHRVSAAREVIGEASLYVDANGAYARKQALALANEFADLGVAWFEEPVSSDDREPQAHPRSFACRHRDRSRRIWLRSLLFSPHARGGRRRRTAGGRHAMRRLHGFSPGRRARTGMGTAAVGPHRTGAASAGVLRSAGPSQHRMVPRPRAHRAAPLRRLTSAKAWMHPPQSHETGPWAEFEGPQCRALVGPLKTNAAGGT